VKTVKLLFEKQIYNYLGLAVLLAILSCLAKFPGVNVGRLWGIDTQAWFGLSIGVVIVHQFYVWIVWRTELHLGLMSKWFGKRAFSIWAVSFMILLVMRFSIVFVLGYSNRGTWYVHPALGWGLTFIILAPAIYTSYSIIKYFSIKRALGIDHFDPAYRQLGLVRKGMYRFTPNAMYVFAAMVVWIPALIFASKAALISAFFNYAYLWVHYFTLEKPDMRRIYADQEESISDS